MQVELVKADLGNIVKDDIGNTNVINLAWFGLKGGDYGKPWSQAAFNDKTYQIVGDFAGGATVTLQGSNVFVPDLETDDDWVTLTDTNHMAISHSSVGGGQILQNYRWIRAKVVGDAGASIYVYLCGVKGF